MKHYPKIDIQCHHDSTSHAIRNVCHILGLCALVITLPTFTGLYEITLENLTISDFKDNGSQRF